MERTHVIRAATPALKLEDAVDALAECGTPISRDHLHALCTLGELDWFGIPGHGLFISLASLRPLGLTAGNRQ